MRKIGSLLSASFLILTLGLIAAPSAYAQQSGKQDVSQVVNSDDAAKLKQGIQDLGQAFGVSSPTPSPTPSATPDSKKTIADVADKALNMVGSLTAQLSKVLEQVAPQVWRIMIKQQYAKAIGHVTVPVGFLMVVLSYAGVVHLLWKRPEDVKSDDHAYWLWGARIVPIFCGVLFGIWFFIALAGSIMILINPEYYAIQDLLRMLMRQ